MTYKVFSYNMLIFSLFSASATTRSVLKSSNRISVSWWTFIEDIPKLYFLIIQVFLRIEKLFHFAEPCIFHYKNAFDICRVFVCINDTYNWWLDKSTQSMSLERLIASDCTAKRINDCPFQIVNVTPFKGVFQHFRNSRKSFKGLQPIAFIIFTSVWTYIL